MRILVVDDDPDLRDVMSYLLRKRGHIVAGAPDGEAALAAVHAQPLDLVVMDYVMPRLDGLEACRRIREISPIPIIMLTVRGAEEDIIHSLELGADDHMTKPFSHREFVARVEALLRRSYELKAQLLVQTATTIERDDLVIIPDRHQVLRAGESIRLTPTEFKLLHYLMLNEGLVLSPTTILEHVWGYGSETDMDVVRVSISRLRHKVEPNPAHPCYVHTFPGVGYSFRSAPVA